MDSSNINNNLITPKQVLQISCVLRGLGLNNKYIGTKLINKAIQKIVTLNEDDFYLTEDIYKMIAKENSQCTPNQIRNSINYTLYKRNRNVSKKNFEKYFHLDYDESFFKNSRFIEEVAHIIKIESEY